MAIENEVDQRRWGVPFYQDFAHGNLLAPERYGYRSPPLQARQEWLDLVRREMKNITPEIAGDLIMDRDWRPQICGAYFCGLNCWDDFTLDLGRRLVAKKNGYATQGYAFALARMPSHASANYLCGYLSRVGHHTDKTDWYALDSEWVIAALQWVDEQMNTYRIEPYMERLIPIWQKNRYENLRKWQQEAAHIVMRGESLNTSFAEEAERNLVDNETEMQTYFLPDDGERRSEWFWKLMEFCHANFD